MKHIPTIMVGLTSYALFLLASCYGISFTLGGLLPDPVAAPHLTGLTATLVDVALIMAFGVQHSVMARAGWKQMWTRIIPPTLERSLYVLIASCILLAIFWCWQPIPTSIWQINAPLARILVYGVCLAGWGIVVLSTFQIDHFELFGLKQIWRSIRRQPQLSPEFRLPLLYRFVRHPMMGGFLVAFWATPTMTVDRLIFAAAMSAYILLGVSFEERSLRREFGPVYTAYQADVPRLIPFLRIPRILSGFTRTKPGHTRSGSAIGD